MLSCSLTRPTVLYSVTDTHSRGNRQCNDPQRMPFIRPGVEAVVVHVEKKKIQNECALHFMLCLVFRASKASLRQVCGFYGLWLHNEVWLQPAGSTAVLEVGLEEKKTSSCFNTALQTLERESVCMCVYLAFLSAFYPPAHHFNFVSLLSLLSWVRECGGRFSINQKIHT